MTEKHSMDLHPQDRQIVASSDAAVLALWWCALNVFEWPDAFPDPEPPHYKRGDRRGQLMALIKSTIGAKACIRAWHKHYVHHGCTGQSDVAFDAWWESVGRHYHQATEEPI